MNDAKVLRQEYHRNGVGGAGFVVSTVDWPEATDDGATGPFLAISFPENDEDRYTPQLRRALFIENTAVLNIERLAAGIIGMHEAPGNAWRGSDALGPVVAEAWHERCLNNPDFGYDPFGCGHEKATAQPDGSGAVV